eukprot:1156238-Pelagomonas_calceolata.AAC.1
MEGLVSEKNFSSIRKDQGELSSTLINLLTPGALLIRLSIFVTKIRHGLLLVTLLIPIDFFLMFLLVKGMHGASALGILFSLFKGVSLSAWEKKRKAYASQKAACTKERSPNWKAKGFTRRPSKPTLDAASLGERAINSADGDREGCPPCSWMPGLSFSCSPLPCAQRPPPPSPRTWQLDLDADDLAFCLVKPKLIRCVMV